MQKFYGHESPQSKKLGTIPYGVIGSGAGSVQ